MSLKEYMNIDKKITGIYTTICSPCMDSYSFYGGKCRDCKTMKVYVELQKRKKELEEENE